MKKTTALIAAFLSMLIIQAAFGEGRAVLRVSVLEFDTINSIGLNGTATILPEYLYSALREIGRYELSERILLSKVLAEHELELSGIGDERKAAEIGKMFGVDAIATGVAMKVNNKIIVSGRLIDVVSGEVIYGARVQCSSINELGQRMEELAYYLSGYSPREYRAALFEKGLGGSKLGIRLGGGSAAFAMPNRTVTPILMPSVGIEYRSKVFETSLSFSGIGEDFHSLRGLISAYLFLDSRAALSFAWQMDADRLGYFQARDRGFAGEYEDMTSPFHTFYMGASYRILPTLRTSVLYGGIASGSVDKFWNGNLTGTYDYNTFKNGQWMNLNFVLEVQWLVKNFSVTLSLWTTEAMGIAANGDTRQNHMGSNCVSLEFGYSLPL